MLENVRSVVEALQAVPRVKLVHNFLFVNPTRYFRGRSFTLELASANIVPLVEAIGMRLQWCLDEGFDPSGCLRSPDRLIDAMSLLSTLECLMVALRGDGWPVNEEGMEEIRRAYAELSDALAEVEW